MRAKLVRSMIAGFLLGSFLIGSLVSYVQLGVDPLSGGVVFATFTSVSKSSNTSGAHGSDRLPVGYTKNFPIVDGSKISVTIRGIRSDDSILGFRLQGKSLISYEYVGNEEGEGAHAFSAPSRKASQREVDVAFSATKELIDVPSDTSQVSEIPSADDVIPKLATLPIESNPYSGWSHGPPGVSITSA